MTSWPLVIVLCTMAVLWPADPAPDGLARSAEIRCAAEADLAQARQDILARRADLLAEIQRGAAAAAEARAAVARWQRTLDDLRHAEEARRSIRAVQAEQDARRAERALLAAGLDPAGQPPEPVARAAAALAEIDARIAALADGLGIRRAAETVAGRDGAPRVVPVLRLGAARAVALGDAPAARGLLRPAAAGGLPQVAGPDVRWGAGEVPLDPDGRGIDAVVSTWSLAGWLAAGRMFIWPILAVLVAGVVLGIARLVGVLGEREPGPPPRCWPATPPPDQPGWAAQLRRTGWELRHAGRAERESALEGVLVGAEVRLHRHLDLILVLAGVAPLLGLLGTVTGMIDLFATLSGGAEAKGISHAISEALVTTQAGMIAAIPLLLGHAFLRRLADHRFSRLEEDAFALLAVMSEPATTTAAEP